MATATKEKKTGRRIFKKSYAQLIREKKKVEGALQALVAGQKSTFWAGPKALLDMAQLKIRGGPHDLSSKLRDYLYDL